MRAVFLKLSGESLSKDGEHWHVDAQAEVGQKIADVYHRKDELGISGLTLVPGGGNIARGDNLKHVFGDKADAIGRQATKTNATALSVALDRLHIPNVMMLSDKMSHDDVALKMDRYSLEAVWR